MAFSDRKNPALRPDFNLFEGLPNYSIATAPFIRQVRKGGGRFLPDGNKANVLRKIGVQKKLD